MKEAKTWIVMNNMHRYCSLGNKFEPLKYGSSTLKWSVGSHTHSSCPRRHCTRYDRAINDISLRAAENEDQNHNCPRREMNDGRVSSLAWMMPRWKPARELHYQGTGLNDAQNGYHSPPGAAKVIVWKNLEVLVYSRNHLRSLQTLNNLDDKAAGPGIKVYRSKDSIWT